MGERVGIAVIGLNGAVATTAAAGIAMIRAGSNDLSGLPLASRDVEGMAAYRDLHFGGWDLSHDDLATAALKHGVLSESELANGASSLSDMQPWPAVGSTDFCANIDGANKIAAPGHRAAVQHIQDDLARFKTEQNLDRVVMINLASTERKADLGADALTSAEGFERGLDDDDAAISPAMLYAYAAIASDTPYANFTPSVAADVAPLAELARQRGVPIAGKDGKTGQTLLKTVIAPALRDRALHVDGWFSTNILGNSDGLALDDPKSLASKVDTKKSVLDQILGYPVEDHIIMIHYYKPRGDNKEAWDNIDLTGFLGQKMQLKLNFLCKDSVLAAPLAIEIARCLALAQTRGEGGVQDQMGIFFKMPQTADGGEPIHAFGEQQLILDTWLDRR
ncbi:MULTISPECIES: inositol-3-phosphate synthase [unclassified Sphingomonas]|uniref:inositol-3-phosphate synthase n=1 Tax=unclassified Sphingomonas TaxID=196159 RepID=UPI000E730A93|nr:MULTISPECIES: inositol-3-phosphate synthase [unclassified Sphingomonas]RKE50600.1 myo-inositol-1-phosphate synthase [Sphingomonas sp. PP-CC-1A-547]TCM08895.1 myo-inositol-1-phosphate synthase [Sphingomonas sp. PP-CC-3G-468]